MFRREHTPFIEFGLEDLDVEFSAYAVSGIIGIDDFVAVENGDFLCEALKSDKCGYFSLDLVLEERFALGFHQVAVLQIIGFLET